MGAKIPSEVKNYINGSFTSFTGDFLDVFSPTNGEKISKVPLSTSTEVDKAVKAAREAYKSWGAMTIRERSQIFFRYRELLIKNEKHLAKMCNIENGKTVAESVAEVAKSIEIVEFATSLTQLAAGELMEVSKGIECRIEKKPVGVIASIAPFNFPVMVPHWTIPNALVLGNTMVMKPSEQVPLSTQLIAELLKEAGLPDGVFNIVNGDKAVVEGFCDHEGIDAVTFVGSTKVAKIVYQRAAASLKRVVCLGGAKNHLIVLPDANKAMAASDIAASMSGCCGQRCMAASAMVGVGDVDHIINQLVEDAKKIVPGENLGAVISKAAVERIEGYITEAEKQGAKILLDGRNYKVANHENGFYVGPTVIDQVKPSMKIAQEEVFGPVLSIMRTDDVDQAIKIENDSPYGNAAAVYTSNGGNARYVMERVSAGMVGVNIGVPVPREPFSFGGWNDSKFGVGDITGKSSIEFFTSPRKQTTKWNLKDKKDWMS